MSAPTDRTGVEFKRIEGTIELSPEMLERFQAEAERGELASKLIRDLRKRIGERVDAELEEFLRRDHESGGRALSEIFSSSRAEPGIHTREEPMVEKARCKFVCESTKKTRWGTGHQLEVELEADYDHELTEEDEAFSEATPVGSMQFTVDNPALEGFFEPGRYYYIDITPVPESDS